MERYIFVVVLFDVDVEDGLGFKFLEAERALIVLFVFGVVPVVNPLAAVIVVHLVIIIMNRSPRSTSPFKTEHSEDVIEQTQVPKKLNWTVKYARSSQFYMMRTSSLTRNSTESGIGS